MEFLNIEINEKFFIKILVISIALVITYMAFTMSSLLIFKSYTLGPNTSVTSIEPEHSTEFVPEGKISAHIDLLEVDSKKIEIAGWMFVEGQELKTFNSSFVLKNQETGKMYLMRTQMEDNINLVDEEHKPYGIHAQCLLFGIPKGRYDIYVLYRNNDEDMLVNTLIWKDI